MKYRVNKVLRIVSSFMTTIIGVFGLVLTILAYEGMNKIGNQSTAVWVILIFGNALLVCLGFYLAFSFVKNYKIKMENEEYKSIAEGYKTAQKIVQENQKQIITNYKELTDRLKRKHQKYQDKLDAFKHELDNIRNSFVNSNHNLCWKKYKASCFDKFKKGELEQFTDDIVDNYQRFMGKTTDLLKRNVEEYLKAKGCNEDVSVAVKQLDVSVLFSQLNNNTDNRCKEINVYTAFRDSRTYFNKGRQETWKSTYKIHKNSAFLNSVDREYYIFNYFDRAMIENGIYKNENNIFYNQYNCGVTCSIYSCINGERKLFGYLACDSLINVKKKKKYKNVYDWHIAVMTMLVANIIALYLQNFEDIWTQVHGSDNFCAYMAERVKKTRYGK